MARYTGPKVRQMRRSGRNLNLKSSRSKAAKRFADSAMTPPGQHGANQRSKLSTYGVQLREKQALKWIYGVLERQFRLYMVRAMRYTGVTGTVLMQLLERRLDNVCYRAGYAVTRAGARQLVRHNHVLVNGKRVNIPSYEVRPGDVISITEAAKGNSEVQKSLAYAAEDGRKPWISWDDSAKSATFVSIPSREDLEDVPVKEQLIVELYSR